MPGRAVNVTARILFFLSGVASLAVAALYAMLRGAELPYQWEWVIFAVVLTLAGAVNVLAAILLTSWTARICRVTDKSSVLPAVLPMFGVFAAVSYVITVGLYFTPHEWNLSGFVWTFLLCPVYIVRQTFDPRPVAILLILAPLNAVVYGAIGSVVGFGRSVSKTRLMPIA